jgi:hypothetical protein
MNIKELAEQAGIFGGEQITIDSLEQFAKLIRQDEREACAALCDEWFAATAGRAIRDRGEK